MTFFGRHRHRQICIAALLAAALMALSAVGASAQSAAPPPAGESLASASEGNAFTNKSLLGIVRDGGFMMYPLFASSFVLMVFAFERAISLRTGRVIPGPFVKRFVHQLQEGQ